MISVNPNGGVVYTDLEGQEWPMDADQAEYNSGHAREQATVVEALACLNGIAYLRVANGEKVDVAGTANELYQLSRALQSAADAARA
jgi:hypothetical protein